MSPIGRRWDTNTAIVCLLYPDRARTLADALDKDESALAQLERREHDHVEWFTKDALNNRKPDFIAVDSLYYQRFFDNEEYPEMRLYFRSLLGERFNYCIVFDHRSPDYPEWVYPKNIDFLKNRIVILKRKQTAGDDCSERIAEQTLLD